MNGPRAERPPDQPAFSEEKRRESFQPARQQARGWQNDTVRTVEVLEDRHIVIVDDDVVDLMPRHKSVDAVAKQLASLHVLTMAWSDDCDGSCHPRSRYTCLHHLRFKISSAYSEVL